MATAEGVGCHLGEIRGRQSGSGLQPLLGPSGGFLVSDLRCGRLEDCQRTSVFTAANH